MSPRLRALVSAGLLAALVPAAADEGMWTFNDFPSAKVAQRYGFAPTRDWLDHLRLSSVRMAAGCSGSIVSAQGLVMTNHHCVRNCIVSVSGLARRDFNRDGFLARTPEAEARCPGMELNQLIAIDDVTGDLQRATRDADAAHFADAKKAAIAAIEKRCATSDEWRCEVVSLYRGGRYELYRYRRLQDIRLVFAPEESVAFFGGDPDNFTFPRYDLDVAFVRIYGPDGRPMATAHHLAWATDPVREGDVTFVSGHPGGTSRTKTLAQIEAERDSGLPAELGFVAEFRGLMSEYQYRGAEQQRHSDALRIGFSNGLKAVRGQQAALADPAFVAKLARDEQALRARVAADPELQRTYGAVWDRIADLVKKEQAWRKEYLALEKGQVSRLFEIARGLVRHADETAKPNGERLKEFTDARLPQLRSGLLANQPIHRELEIATLTWSLARMREELGPDHPAVKRMLGRRSPHEVARDAVNASRVGELRVDRAGRAVGGLRKVLLDGGKAAIAASGDPMIRLARSFDDDARAIRSRMENEVEGPMEQQLELLARARFAVHGTDAYPDATFTLRLSYGSVQGYVENGAPVQPFTTLGGAFERHTGSEPFVLPRSWLAARDRIRPDVPMNFVTTNDIVGGNSGSPVVNEKGEVVGLVFDVNIHGLGGTYGFDEATNRTVALHAAALVEALDRIYGADRVLAELGMRPQARARLVQR
jgi:hypothetical protein